MLLSESEIQFDFQGAEFDLKKDREILQWIFSQFLYGEVTGIQIGHWIYNAPDLERAQFLVRQCAQELSHVRIMRTIFDLLEVEPLPAHRIVKYLSTGLMGASWDEHVCLEMALGEGYVLTVFYSLIDVIPDPRVQRLLRIAAKQEATHVAFGEQQTIIAAEDPRTRNHLLGLSLITLNSVRRLARFLEGRTARDHPVFSRFPELVEHCVDIAEIRLQRMGVLRMPLKDLSTARRWSLMGRSMAVRAVAPLRSLRKKRITSTYLQDPLLNRPAPAKSP